MGPSTCCRFDLCAHSSHQLFTLLLWLVIPHGIQPCHTPHIHSFTRLGCQHKQNQKIHLSVTNGTVSHAPPHFLGKLVHSKWVWWGATASIHAKYLSNALIHPLDHQPVRNSTCPPPTLHAWWGSTLSVEFCSLRYSTLLTTMGLFVHQPISLLHLLQLKTSLANYSNKLCTLNSLTIEHGNLKHNIGLVKMVPQLVYSGGWGCHWGQGHPETSGNILGTCQGLGQFYCTVTNRHIYGTFEMCC